MKKKTHPIAKPARHPYSKRFREEYGRSLSREEIRLVQAYRGLAGTPRAALLLETASQFVICNVQEHANRGAR